MKLNDKQRADKVAQRLIEVRERGIMYRDATVSAIDAEARTVELSFSSETEKVERWYGVEVLGHGEGECDLERMNNKAPALWMHDWDDQRGVVEPGTARIDSDRKGRCTVRFSRSAAGEELFQDVIDGIKTKISVGYVVTGMRLEESREDVDVYRITGWQPYEVSFVSVAADDDVGVGRIAEIPQEEREKQNKEDSATINGHSGQSNSTRNDINMNEKILRDGQGNLVRAKVDDSGKIVEVLEMIERAGDAAAAATARGADAERNRVRAIAEMGKQYGAAEKAQQFIIDGKSPEDFQRELLHGFATERSAKPMAEQQRDANIGMTDKEVRQYSIFKAIRALDPQATNADKEAAKFEIECSRAAADKYGKQSKGIIIPNDVLADRAFGTGGNGTSGNGQAAIANHLLSGSFIDLLRNRTWLMQRARTLTGLVGNVDIPKQTASTQAYWVGEGGAPNASTPGLDQISFTPKTVGAYTDITRRLLKQATPDAEAITRDDLLKVLALEIDRVGIYGTGTEFQPKGLRNYSGINATTFDEAGKPTFEELVDMETKIALDNADVDSMSYVGNAAFRGHCKTALKFQAAGSATLWEPGNTVNGYATDISNQIASGDVFFGNWQDLVIAMWGGLELTVDPYALSTSGGLRLIVLQDIDINLRRLESFTYGKAA